jgi:hypothetical protein
MTKEEELKRRIELKRQLILLTVDEIWKLEDELWKIKNNSISKTKESEN